MRTEMGHQKKISPWAEMFVHVNAFAKMTADDEK